MAPISAQARVLATVAASAVLLGGCATTDGPRLDQRPDKQRTPSADSTDSPVSPTTTPGHLRPKGLVSKGWRVSRVVDGDTVEVTRGTRTLDVRLIGIDTPETVHPTEPIECFGPEASSYARRKLEGEPVLLEYDRTQGRRDYYGRSLAYIWLDDRVPELFNLDAVRRGYAVEYTYDAAYRWQREFQRAEDRARDARLGVWRCPDPGS